MNIEYLRYFIVVADTLNLNKASEKLHITPPALSKAVKTLEDYYNVKLLERDKNIKGLTPEGEFLLNRAKELINQYQNFDTDMQELKYNYPQGNLLIGCDSMCQNYILPDLIEKLLCKYNKIIPKIYTMIPDDVEKNLLSNNIQVGFLSKKIINPDICSIKYMETESVIVSKSKNKSKWNKLEYIVPNIFNRKVSSSLDGWNDSNFPRKIKLEVESLEAGIIFCEKGIGVAFLPKIAIEDKLKNKTLHIVSNPPQKYTENIYIVYKKTSRITSSITGFLEIIK